MYNPIPTEFFDQLTVTMEVIDGFEFLVLDTKEKISLSLVLMFNGKKYRED